MKKLFLIMAVILALLTGCNDTSTKVTIITDRNSYTPLMSSAQGIKMTPSIESKKSYEKLIYHWEAAEGEFIGIGKEVDNQGEAVVWSAVEDDKVADIKKPFDIKLEVIDSSRNKVLAAERITIVPNNVFYEIKK